MEDKVEKYSLVTGATGGLGRAFVEKLAERKENLVLVATNIDRLNSFKEELQSRYDISIKVFKCDFSIKTDLDNLVKFVTDKQFAITTLVNNAGYICEGSNDAMSVESLQKCIFVNNVGTTTITKAVLDAHDTLEHLDIINISSLGANYPMPYMAVYSASKSYIKNYMLALREEYSKKNVNITTVLPGAIATSEDMKNAIVAQGLKGRLSQVSADKIAMLSLKQVKKNKAIYIPGWFNKLTNCISKLTPLSFQTRVAGNMWRKSQNKRGIR